MRLKCPFNYTFHFNHRIFWQRHRGTGHRWLRHRRAVPVGAVTEHVRGLPYAVAVPATVAATCAGLPAAAALTWLKRSLECLENMQENRSCIRGPLYHNYTSVLQDTICAPNMIVRRCNIVIVIWHRPNRSKMYFDLTMNQFNSGEL